MAIVILGQIEFLVAILAFVLVFAGVGLFVHRQRALVPESFLALIAGVLPDGFLEYRQGEVRQSCRILLRILRFNGLLYRLGLVMNHNMLHSSHGRWIRQHSILYRARCTEILSTIPCAALTSECFGCCENDLTKCSAIVAFQRLRWLGWFQLALLVLLILLEVIVGILQMEWFVLIKSLAASHIAFDLTHVNSHMPLEAARFPEGVATNATYVRKLC